VLKILTIIYVGEGVSRPSDGRTNFFQGGGQGHC
jgi:hypothetical protein